MNVVNILCGPDPGKTWLGKAWLDGPLYLSLLQRKFFKDVKYIFVWRGDAMYLSKSFFSS